MTNTASASAGGTTSPDDTATANGLPRADLAVTKDDGNTTVATGDSVTYVVVVTNNGPDAVTGAVLTDPVVTGLTKTAVACAASMPGNCVSDPTIASLESGFALPALADGDSYALEVTVTVDAISGSVINAASVSVPSGTIDPDPTNNSDDDEDLIEDIYDPPYGVKVGTLENGNTQIRWTMVWQNGTGVPVPDVTITDDTSAYSGWSYLGPVTCTGNGATVVNSCGIIGDIITVNADFGVDEDVDTLEISFLAAIDDPLQGSYVNQAEATCADCGGNSNSSDDDTPLESDPTEVLLPLPVTPVPTLPWLALMLLSLLMGGYGVQRIRIT